MAKQEKGTYGGNTHSKTIVPPDVVIMPDGKSYYYEHGILKPRQASITAAPLTSAELLKFATKGAIITGILLSLTNIAQAESEQRLSAVQAEAKGWLTGLAISSCVAYLCPPAIPYLVGAGLFVGVYELTNRLIRPCIGSVVQTLSATSQVAYILEKYETTLLDRP